MREAGRMFESPFAVRLRVFRAVRWADCELALRAIMNGEIMRLSVEKVEEEEETITEVGGVESTLIGLYRVPVLKTVDAEDAFFAAPHALSLPSASGSPLSPPL